MRTSGWYSSYNQWFTVAAVLSSLTEAWQQGESPFSGRGMSDNEQTQEFAVIANSAFLNPTGDRSRAARRRVVLGGISKLIPGVS